MVEFFKRHKFAVKWLGLAFLIKLSLFLFFAANFIQNWPAELITNSIFITSGDTHSYYTPLESFVNGMGYDSYCRMPGLLPFYIPLRWVWDENAAKAGIIIIQFLFSVISVYLLARIARHILKSEQAFHFVFFIYALSSFVSIWDHLGMSDSFGTSLLIFSVFCLMEYQLNQSKLNLFLCGFFLTWSIFFRAAHSVFVPVILFFFLFHTKTLFQSIKNSLVFGISVLLFLGLWTYKNYSQYHKAVVLTGPFDECTRFLSKEHLAIRELIIAWGGDYQPWSKGSEAEWFFAGGVKDKTNAPSRANIYTSKYNLDSLISLRRFYEIARSDSVDAGKKKLCSNLVLKKSSLYVESFKREHKFDYYLYNRLVLLRKIMIPGRLDDLPLPAFAKMNLFQKLTKSFYFLLLIFVNVFGFIGSCLCLIRGNRWASIPLSLLVVIGIVFGYVEQRYLVPIYPFFVVFSTSFVLDLWQKFKLTKQGKIPN